MPIKNYEAKLQLFCAWLKQHGASYPKIEWPSTDTVGGCRGAKAVERIDANEVMLEIPIALMMSPVHAFADPILGKMFQSSQDILRGDVLLSVYIMSEVLKGPESFYAPYLAILPEPGSIIQWKDDELLQLEDENIRYRARTRGKMLRHTYERSLGELSKRYPHHFPLTRSTRTDSEGSAGSEGSEGSRGSHTTATVAATGGVDGAEKYIGGGYTHELFLFAWFCVQARAFGRRLPWTALVPFADCLNHSNVQTKYDYDIDKNGVFRLYPTGSNSYSEGCEVFNSYGKRPNDNLLLDYGFAMLDNMWDAVDVSLTLTGGSGSRPRLTSSSSADTGSTSTDEDDDSSSAADVATLVQMKTRVLYAMGYHATTFFSLQRSTFPLEALAYARISVMTNSEFEQAQLRNDEIDSTLRAELHIRSEMRNMKKEMKTNKKQQQQQQQCEFEVNGISPVPVVITDVARMESMISSDSNSNSESDEDDDENIRKTMAQLRRRKHVIGIQNSTPALELAAITHLKGQLNRIQATHWSSTADADELLLNMLKLQAKEKEYATTDTRTSTGAGADTIADGSTDDDSWKMISAVTYRLTRKRIVEVNIVKLEILEAHLRATMAKARAILATRRLAVAMTDALNTSSSSISIVIPPLQQRVPSSVFNEITATGTATDTATSIVPGIGARSSSRQLHDDMERVDCAYNIYEPPTVGTSPYKSSAGRTSFVGDRSFKSSLLMAKERSQVHEQIQGQEQGKTGEEEEVEIEIEVESNPNSRIALRAYIHKLCVLSDSFLQNI